MLNEVTYWHHLWSFHSSLRRRWWLSNLPHEAHISACREVRPLVVDRFVQRVISAGWCFFCWHREQRPGFLYSYGELFLKFFVSKRYNSSDAGSIRINMLPVCSWNVIEFMPERILFLADWNTLRCFRYFTKLFPETGNTFYSSLLKNCLKPISGSLSRTVASDSYLI